MREQGCDVGMLEQVSTQLGRMELVPLRLLRLYVLSAILHGAVLDSS